MERFAFKIDKALRANLYKICRLCGMDNPEMVPILTGNEGAAPAPAINADDEPELSQKIQQCIGFIIAKDDKMPQTMCTMCVEKINDFHEFREMCFATNSQTRKLLGLKAEVPKKIVIADIKPVVEIKDESLTSTALGKKSARKRKLEEASSSTASTTKGKGVAAAATAAAASTAFAVVDEVKKEDASPAAKKLRLSESLTLNKGKQKFLTPKERRLHEIQKKLTERTGVQLLPKEEIKDEPPERSAGTGAKVAATAKAAANTKVAAATASIATAVTATGPAIAAAGTASTMTPGAAAPRHRQLCNICDQRFSTKIKLEKHLSTVHMPVIPRFYCNTCDETIKKAVDIKNHQLWHKLSKTPYICALCGESLISIYAFSRHLREHCPEYPTAVLVLDRQCPQCQQTYATNFLYNTHPCAVRTKRCAGCNRKQSSETGYMTHSASCTKTYLNYSKHIPAAAAAAESSVRIKNENDVEEAAAAEALARSTGISLDLTPVVSLTRLPSPVVMAVNQCVAIPGGHEALLNPRTSKRVAGKRGGGGVSKKDFKRVDELLKSTIDALVSIKHEPEVHVETDAPSADADEADGRAHADAGAFNDDFHHGDDDDDDDGHEMDGCARAGAADLASVVIKEEPGILNHQHNNMEMSIKKEIIDVDEYEAGGTGGTSAKVPILKLKIKKEHGTLNSSLVNAGEGGRSERKKNKKEKKKRKDTEKNRDKMAEKNQNSQDSMSTEQNISENAASAGIIQPCFVRIKQEHFDDDYVAASASAAASNIQINLENNGPNDEAMPTSTLTQPEATVMTSIPLMQFQISFISSGVEFTREPQATTTAELQAPHVEVAAATTTPAVDEEEVRDIKPNRMELDRMLKITNITSGANMQAAEAESAATTANDVDMQAAVESAATATDDGEVPSTTLSPNKRKAVAKKPKKPAAKAMKSTGGVARATTRKSSIAETPPMQILDVRSGADVVPPIIIKPEPLNRGYSDEQPQPQQEQMDCGETAAVQPASARKLNELTINEVDMEAHSNANNNDEDDEQSYIAKIDFNNLKIKQEKDIDVSEVQLSRSSIPATSVVRSCNGIKQREVKRKMQKRKRKDSKDNAKDGAKIVATRALEPVEAEGNDDLLENHHNDEGDEDLEEEENGEEFDDEEEEAEEEQEEEYEEEAEQEVREYREMELPPLLATDIEGNDEQLPMEQTETDASEIRNEMPTLLATDNKAQMAMEQTGTGSYEIGNNAEITTPTVGETAVDELQPSSEMTPTFVITNVCSHAEVEVTKEPVNIEQNILVQQKEKPAQGIVQLANPSEQQEESPAEKQAATADDCSSSKEENILALGEHIVDEHAFAAENCTISNRTIAEESVAQEESKLEKQAEGNCALLGQIEASATVNTFDWKISAVTSGRAELNFELDLPAAVVAAEPTIVAIPQANVGEDAETSFKMEIPATVVETSEANDAGEENRTSLEMELPAAAAAVAATPTIVETSAANAGEDTKTSASTAQVPEETDTKDHRKAATTAETASISGAIVEEPETTTKAQPFYEARTTDEITADSGEETNLSAADSVESGDDSMSAACDVVMQTATDAAVEEQQNLLNDEMAAREASAGDILTTTATAFQLHPYLEDITSSSGSGFSSRDATNDATDETASTSAAAAVKIQLQQQQQRRSEETDNRNNENADAALRQMHLALNPNHALRDENVNEIAENNNNANIERELLDDNEREPLLNDFNAAAANAAAATEDAAACDRLI